MKKVNITVSVEKEIKDKVFEIIHYQRRESLSAWINEKFKEFLEENDATAN